MTTRTTDPSRSALGRSMLAAEQRAKPLDYPGFLGLSGLTDREVKNALSPEHYDCIADVFADNNVRGRLSQLRDAGGNAPTAAHYMSFLYESTAAIIRTQQAMADAAALSYTLNLCTVCGESTPGTRARAVAPSMSAKCCDQCAAAVGRVFGDRVDSRRMKMAAAWLDRQQA